MPVNIKRFQVLPNRQVKTAKKPKLRQMYSNKTLLLHQLVSKNYKKNFFIIHHPIRSPHS